MRNELRPLYHAAFIDAAGVRTYAQLEAVAVQLAAHLWTAGIRSGDRLAFVATCSWPTLCLFWASWKIGAITCPLGRQWPAAVVDQVAAQVDVRQIWRSAAEVDELVTQAGARQPPIPPLAILSAPAAEGPEADRLPATIIFSSGTTAAPRAVVHSLSAHRLNAAGAAANIPLGPGDRWLWSLPPHHVSGLSLVFRCSLAGAALVAPLDEAPLGESVARHDISHLSVVPLQLQRLLEQSEFPGSSLRAVLLGGSAAPRPLVTEAHRRRVPLHTTYGLTEMASQVTTTRAGAPLQELFTSGQLLPHRELRIGEEGEILVRGETLCLGYWQSGQIVPVVDEGGWFATRDRGKLDEAAALTVLGRLDNMFISGGENIYPEQIERGLLELGGVRQAVVVPIDDPRFGQRPVAFVDADPREHARILQQLASQLPSCKLPVALHPWPTEILASGIKPDRQQLTRLAGTLAGCPAK